MIKISNAPSGTNKAGLKAPAFYIAVRMWLSDKWSKGLIDFIYFLYTISNMWFILAPPDISFVMSCIDYPPINLSGKMK